MKTSGVYPPLPSGLSPMRLWIPTTGSLLLNILSWTFQVTHVRRTKNTITEPVWRRVLQTRWDVDQAGIAGVTKGGISALILTSTGICETSQYWNLSLADSLETSTSNLIMKNLTQSGSQRAVGSLVCIWSTRSRGKAFQLCLSQSMPYFLSLPLPGLPAGLSTESSPTHCKCWSNDDGCRYTSNEREELLYPSSTMIAEVGDNLSLSFIFIFILSQTWLLRWVVSLAFSWASPSWPYGTALSGWRSILSSSNLAHYTSS